MTSPSQHLFWIASSAAGICALVMASLAVTAGLALGGHLGALRGRSAQVRTLHEACSIAALLALAVHGLALLGDAYLKPGIAGIAIPFAGAYRPFWTGLGIIGAYGLAALSLSYYARRRIGVARWRVLHRFVALFWLLGIVHTLGAGTDTGHAWFLVLLAIVVGPPFALLAMRWGQTVDVPVEPSQGAHPTA
ncbi:MAG TPA: ferric reductase-like transmembrane domain-containing protein [Solirubrobacteraceae bacterium]|jgi:sulfoxide reductase heme-binding subunit YedZ|nr:ferric reductase-like transmembrane domain-containing protein [Solirubrobacteraceae bacterium]